MKDQHVTPPAPGEHLTLETIEGLGPKTADKLRSVGIHSVAELGDFQDPDQLHAHLVSHGVVIPLVRIRNERGSKGNWVAQAKRHSARLWMVDFTADRSKEPPSWTTTVSSEELGIERPFETLDPAIWAGWIFEQSGFPALPTGRVDSADRTDPTHRPEGEGAKAASDSTVVAECQNQLRVVTFDVVEHEPGSERHDELDAQVVLRLSGPDTRRITAGASIFHIDVIAVDESGASSTVASSQQRFEPHVLTYSATLPLRAPSVGQYRLCCLAFCALPSIHFECADGPRLRVVERVMQAS